MSDESRVLSVLRAVAEIAEDRASLVERVRRLEQANLELQQEIEELKVRLADRKATPASRPN